MNWRVILLFSLMITTTASVRAQVQESSPQEPPFVQEDSEFDDAQRIEDEIMSAEPNQPIPPPPDQQQSVDLNETVPEAGSFEDELDQSEDAIVEAPDLMEESAPQKSPSAPAPANPRYRYNSDVVRKSAKGSVEYIHHPQAAKGLLRIERDGTYVYRTAEDTKYTSTTTFRMGVLDAPRITSADGQTTFTQMYTKGPVPVIGFDLEFDGLKFMGPFKFQAGFGAIMASGQGRFISDPATVPKEEYTFAAIPLTAGLIYRLQMKDSSVMAPYISGGGLYIPVVEFRDDGNSPNAVGTPGLYGAGGLLLNVGSVDRETSFNLRNEYGIKNLWVAMEYRRIQTFSDALDFSGGLVNLGVTVDY